MDGVTYYEGHRTLPKKMANDLFTPSIVAAYSAVLGLIATLNKRNATTLRGLREDVKDIQGRCDRYQQDAAAEKNRADVCEKDRKLIHDTLEDAKEREFRLLNRIIALEDKK